MMASHPQPSPFPIIPRPVESIARPGAFELTPQTSIAADAPNRANAATLQAWLAPPSGLPLPVVELSQAGPASICLVMGPPDPRLGAEGYRLTIGPDGVRVEAPGPTGVFYGLQSLRQLLPVAIERRQPQPDMTWRIPAGQIVDAPRFAWRGFMLDEGRHFHGKATVLAILDQMALHKLNLLHWHLTEDQGWRIEIQRYPRLTEVGAQRAGTARSLGDLLRNRHDGQPHAGFYTQTEISEIVAYAAQRQIAIVPEIDLPGHSLAALAAYPELSCQGGPFQVSTRFGIHQDILCAGKEATYTFIKNVLDEILALFPGPYLHIGGDEAPKARWKNCPDCQERLRQLRFEHEHDLQLYLTNRVAAYLGKRGRRLVGWNQIVQPGLDPQAVAQYWVGDKAGLLRAIREGQEVVNSAYLETYLDHSYGLTPLQRAYRFDPVFPELAPNQAAQILGLEAPLWTEWVPNRARLDYQTYPRLTAYAETGWTPAELKDYADFRRRLVPLLERLAIQGVASAPEQDWDPPWYRRLLAPLSIIRPPTHPLPPSD